MDFSSQISGQTVLVTGGRGFIGAPVCRLAAESGAQVISVNRGEHLQPPPGVISVQADLADIGAVQRVFDQHKPDLVLHLASHVFGARDLDMVLPTFHSNLTSTVNLLTVSQRSGCKRVVLTGSLEEPDAEDVTSIPSSPYAAAKFAASAYGRMFHALFDIEVVNLRVFMVYGPAQRDERKLIPYTIRELLAGRNPSFSSGGRMVDWVYLDDVVRAYLHLAVAPGMGGESVDAGTGVLTSVRGVVDEIYRLLEIEESAQFGGVEDRKMEQVRVADVERTHRLIGWTPKYSLSEGLLATIDWLKAHPPGET